MEDLMIIGTSYCNPVVFTGIQNEFAIGIRILRWMEE